MKLGLIGGAYQSGSLPLSAQECINLYPETVSGKERTALRGAPGLSSFSTVGPGPIRGVHEFGGTLYVVSGNTLYSVNSSGVETSIGAIAGWGRVSIADNRAQMIIVNGVQGYIYDGTLTQITDPDFPGLDSIWYIDTYFLGHERSTQRFWASASADGTGWNALDFASKEGAPGDIVSTAINHREVILFGEKTYEFWRNTGASDFQFERQEGLFQERGCGAKHSVQNLDNTVYFLGDDKIVYRINQYAPERVSNHGLEHFLDGVDVSNATAFTMTYKGHFLYVLNVSGVTWVYDATFSASVDQHTWHKRQTGTSRWRAEHYINVYNKHLVGDFSSGVVWELDDELFTDNDAEIHRVRTLAPAHMDGKIFSIDSLELACEVGVGNANVEDPKVWLEISKDGGRSYSPPILRSLGKAGEYKKKVIWRSLGWSSDWVFRLSTTEKCKVEWYEAYVEVSGGARG